MAVRFDTRLRPEIRSLLRRLRKRIRQYVFLDAFARILVMLGFLFWLSFSLDWGYFKVSNLELPIWFRVLFSWAALFGGLLFAAWLMLPLLRIMRSKALALVLERKFPQLDDRLITAVEAFGSPTSHETELTTAMLARTVADVSRAVEGLDVAEVFHRGPLKRAAALAFMFVVSVGSLFVMNQQALARWKEAYVDFKDIYWNRQTTLLVKVIAQPNDQLKDFLDAEGRSTAGRPGLYRHPRGEDLVLVVKVPEGNNAQGVPWMVPSQVTLTYQRSEGRGGGHVTLNCWSGDDRQFQHAIVNLVDGIETLYVKGGDFANLQPYRIDVVNPPLVDRIVLKCDFPDYTGLDTLGSNDKPVRTDVLVQGAQTSLPMETDFYMHATANKPLLGVRLQSDVFELTLAPIRDDQSGSAQLTVFAGEETASREIELPPETVWRFRLIRSEMELHERLRQVVRAVSEIQENSDAQGQIHQQATETAAIEQSFRKLLEKLDRNPVYSRLMLERMSALILDPLQWIVTDDFPALEKTLVVLNQADAAGKERLSHTVDARQAMTRMLESLSRVLGEMSDGSKFDVPLVLSSRSLQQLADPSRMFDDGPLPLLADSPMRIYLSDTDDITSTDPAKLIVSGIVDQPPVVETRLRGVGMSITRKAVIPVVGAIKDDYGIHKAHFNFRVDDEEAWRVRQFRTRPIDRPRDFVLERSPDDRYPSERFEMLPLDLAIGQKLTLTVYAEDSDNLNGPHQQRGEQYTFNIVSNEELLSILYGKELNLRRRFEQIIREVQETQQDLILHRARVEEAETLRAASPQPDDEQTHRQQIEEIDTAIGNSAGRSLHQVRKNAAETKAIEQSFRKILEELVNNAVHSEQMVARIDSLVVVPLHGINTDDFPAVDSAVNLFKQAHDKGIDLKPRIDQSIEAIALMLQHMRIVLGEMKDLVEFHEALRDLESIIKEEETLTDETKEQQKREAIEKLKRLGID